MFLDSSTKVLYSAKDGNTLINRQAYQELKLRQTLNISNINQ